MSAAKGEVDLVFTADDLGGQNGLLMSLDMWERFIKPYHVKLNAEIHEYGARVIYHSDGGIMDAIPGLIDAKIDVLQALQFDAAGRDAVAMKKLYGRRLCFQGGVSVQKTLPFGTSDQVREEVQHLISTLGRNGGYILGPSHAIQAGTPPENIYAMYQGVFAHGSFAGNLLANPAAYLSALAAAILWALYSNLTRRLASLSHALSVPAFLFASGLFLGVIRLFLHETTRWNGTSFVELGVKLPPGVWIACALAIAGAWMSRLSIQAIGKERCT
jgi:hypothetical protein